MQTSSLAKNKKSSPNCKKMSIDYGRASTWWQTRRTWLALSNDDKYIIKWFDRSAAARVLDATISEDAEPSIKMKVRIMLFVVRFWSKLKNSIILEKFPSRPLLTFSTFAYSLNHEFGGWISQWKIFWYIFRKQYNYMLEKKPLIF